MHVQWIINEMMSSVTVGLIDIRIPKGTVADLSYIEFNTISRTIAQYLKKVTNSPESSPHQSILLVAKCVPQLWFSQC